MRMPSSVAVHGSSAWTVPAHSAVKLNAQVNLGRTDCKNNARKHLKRLFHVNNDRAQAVPPIFKKSLHLIKNVTGTFYVH